jgi:hypothetical protein
LARSPSRLSAVHRLADTRAVERNLELEAAAFANLDDLDSWRVFADWLLSKGDARGEIASLAVHRHEGFLSERKGMAARAEALERPFIDEWYAWAQSRDLLDVKVTFKRGFAHSIIGSLTQLQPVIDELFGRDPIQQLSLFDVEPDTLARLFERAPEWLARLRYLKIEGALDLEAMTAMASVELPELRGLNLIGLEIDAELCRPLAHLRTRSLERLILTANQIDEQGLIELLRSPTRDQWRELYLSGNPLDGAALGRLAADKLLALKGLYLAQIEANFGDFAVFADPSVLPTLIRLELSNWGYWQHKAVDEQLRARFGAGLLTK